LVAQAARGQHRDDQRLHVVGADLQNLVRLLERRRPALLPSRVFRLLDERVGVARFGGGTIPLVRLPRPSPPPPPRAPPPPVRPAPARWTRCLACGNSSAERRASPGMRSHWPLSLSAFASPSRSLRNASFMSSNACLPLSR